MKCTFHSRINELDFWEIRILKYTSVFLNPSLLLAEVRRKKPKFGTAEVRYGRSTALKAEVRRKGRSAVKRPKCGEKSRTTVRPKYGVKSRSPSLKAEVRRKGRSAAKKAEVKRNRGVCRKNGRPKSSRPKYGVEVRFRPKFGFGRSPVSAEV